MNVESLNSFIQATGHKGAHFTEEFLSEVMDSDISPEIVRGWLYGNEGKKPAINYSVMPLLKRLRKETEDFIGNSKLNGVSI